MSVSFQSLSSEFDARAVHLVNLGYNNRETSNTLQSNESMARTAQVCNSQNVQPVDDDT